MSNKKTWLDDTDAAAVSADEAKARAAVAEEATTALQVVARTCVAHARACMSRVAVAVARCVCMRVAPCDACARYTAVLEWGFASICGWVHEMVRPNR